MKAKGVANPCECVTLKEKADSEISVHNDFLDLSWPPASILQIKGFVCVRCFVNCWAGKHLQVIG